jgi:hypothetical protein
LGNKKIAKKDTASSWRTLLEEYGNKKNASGKKYKEAVIRALYKEGAKGTSWAVTEILNRTMGKAIQLNQTDITSGGQALNASVSFVGAESTAKAIEPIVDQSIGELPESPSD